MKSNYRKLGEFIEQVDIRNEEGSEENLLGLSVQKCFIPSIANTVGTDYRGYKCVKKGQFAYIPDTSRRGDKIAIALLKDWSHGLVSNVYTVFDVRSEKGLLPEYLELWVTRPEFDRYARFKSHGSVREIFDWEQMCNVELPVPSPDVQQKIVAIDNAIKNRIALLNAINGYLEELALTVFNQSLETHKQVTTYVQLGEICDVKGGKRLPKESELLEEQTNHPYIRVRDLNDQTILVLTNEMLYIDEGTHKAIERYIVNSGDLIISVVGTIGLTALIGDSLDGANLTENCNKLTSFSRLSPEWVYSYLNTHSGREAIQVSTVGAVQAKLPLKNIKTIEVPSIPDEVFEEIDQELKTIYSAIHANINEVHKLACLRDALLPKLMSGEIDVSQIKLSS